MQRAKEKFNKFVRKFLELTWLTFHIHNQKETLIQIICFTKSLKFSLYKLLFQETSKVGRRNQQSMPF